MTRTREGELYALVLSFLEGWFPILSLFAINAIGAINTYFFVIVVASLVLLSILGRTEGYADLFKRTALPDLLGTTFFITLLFVLIFIGLRYTTAGNMAVILTLQLFFSYLYFNVIGREKIDRLHTFAAFLMGLGAIVILYPDPYRFNAGDVLIFIAAAIAPLANYYQKRARAHVGSLTILTFRNLVALPFLALGAWLAEGFPDTQALGIALPYVTAVGILIYVVAKIFWIEALHRIGVTKLSAMIAFIPLFTLIFAYSVLHEVPSMQQLIGIIPILVGAYLITRPVQHLHQTV